MLSGLAALRGFSFPKADRTAGSVTIKASESSSSKLTGCSGQEFHRLQKCSVNGISDFEISRVQYSKRSAQHRLKSTQSDAEAGVIPAILFTACHHCEGLLFFRLLIFIPPLE